MYDSSCKRRHCTPGSNKTLFKKLQSISLIINFQFGKSGWMASHVRNCEILFIKLTIYFSSCIVNVTTKPCVKWLQNKTSVPSKIFFLLWDILTYIGPFPYKLIAAQVYNTQTSLQLDTFFIVIQYLILL